MQDIKSVINCCYSLLQNRIVISPYSFTMWQFFIALAVLGLVVWFVSKIFD